MKGSKFRFGALLCVFLLALAALGGCGGSPHNTPGATPNPSPNPQPQPQPQPQVGVLDDWKGEWKSYSSFINAPEMKPVYEAIYAAMQKEGVAGYSLEGVKGFLHNMYYTATVAGFKVEGDTIGLLDNNKKVLCKLKYASRGTQKQNAMGETMEWHLFEAMSAEADNDAVREGYLGSFKYLALGKPERHGDGLEHWHMHFGPSRSDAIAEKLLTWWWPTFVKWDTTAEAAAENTKAGAAFFATLAKTTGPFEPWKDAWVSAISFLDDPAMAKVYKTLAEKASAAGKKTNTPEAVKDVFKVMLNSDFGGIKLEGNTVAILNADGSVKETLSYTYEGIEERKFGEYPLIWSTFQAKSASSYKYLVMMLREQHGTGPVHFHVRYGDKGIAHLLDTPALQGWYPTLCKEGTTAAKYAANILEEADEMVEMLP